MGDRWDGILGEGGNKPSLTLPSMGGTNKPFFEKMKVYFFGVVFGFTTLPHD